MLKKTITYEDYNGNTVTEDYYFNLSKSEAIAMEAKEGNGYGNMLKRIVEEKNIPMMLKIFRTFIVKSVGEKSEDGKHFRKSEQFAKDFEDSAAYDALFSELCMNANAASDFISGILPLNNEQRKEMLAQARAEIAKSSES